MAQARLAPPTSPQQPDTRHEYQVVKDFKAINTKADRTAIQKEQFAWLENIIPQGFGNLQVVPWYSTFPSVWAQPVNQLFSCALNTPNNPPLSPTVLNDFLVAFEIDGSAQYYDITTDAVGTIAAAGTFTTLANMPTGTNIQVAQYKNEMLHILDPVKGLFVWKALGSVVNIGSVGLIIVNAGGTGYTSPPSVTISAPTDPNGQQATAFATVLSGAVTSVTLLNAGSGYTGAAPSISFSGGGGTGATAVASLATFALYTLASVTITNGGSGYTTAPAVGFTPGPGGGSAAAATAIVQGGAVVAVVITNPGIGYTGDPTVTFTGGGGTGAKATATANITPNVAVATFAGRVWVASGRTVSYSAAGVYSYSDFITVSAGTIILTDSTLHGNIVQLLSANNFLYVFGSSSVNVFSDVNVNSSGQTLFTNTTVSSSIGTPFPQAIFNYFRSVLFMNKYGIYALVGATASKISDDLDGVFKFINFAKKITAGQVVVNDQLCAAFNFQYFDAVLGARYIQALYFEKKWWFASQASTVSQITAAQNADSLVMWGTSGTNITQLFVATLVDIPWTIKTPLWSMDEVMRTKQLIRYGVELRTDIQPVILVVTVDSENDSLPAQTIINVVQWVNDISQIVQWQNNSLSNIDWVGTGYKLYAASADQYGKYLGLTISGEAPAAVITGFQMEYTLREVF